MINFAGLKKLCAIITAGCFTVSILNGSSFASVKNSSSISEFEKILSSKAEKQISSLFSDKYGKVVSYKDNNSDTVVINVQDLHCDYFVQKNISSLIEELSKNYKIDTVFVEGGIGTINTEILSQINSQYKKTVLENLLKSGKLTGSEYYNALNDKTDFLKGVEDKETYLQNIVRLSDIINAKNETSVYLSKIEKEIDFLKSKHLNSENKKFTTIADKYENGEISQDKFFSQLLKFAEKNNINITKYKNLKTYLSLFSSDYNEKKLSKEFAELISEMKVALSYVQYKQILNLTSNLTDIKALKVVIDGYCSIKNINLEKKFPNVNKFLFAKQNYSDFNPIELVKEERALVDTLRTYLSETQTELEVAYLSDFKQFYKGYITASLTASQWEYVKLGLDRFKVLYAKYSVSNEVSVLEQYSKLLSDFYDINVARNQIFIDKMGLVKNNKKVKISSNKSVDEMLSDAKKVVVLVAGGYHTDGINEILNKNNISNITITPELSNSNGATRTAYESLVSQQAMSIKQMIALGLISNATQKEQIVSVVNSLFVNQNLDGMNIDILVDQLNRIFADNIKVSLSNENSRIDFVFTDGTKQTVDINEDIKSIVEEQNVTELDSRQIVKVTGEKLKEISDTVLKTTFNFGQELFSPQIYQISKDVCVFTVNNKWYLGNGAIWEIANSSYNGQTLDGVEPVVYEYMPETMQKALLEKQKNNDRKFDIKKVIDKAKRALVSLLVVVSLLSMSACGIINPTPAPPAYTQQQVTEYVNQATENVMYFKEPGRYRFLSYNVDGMTQEDIDEWYEKEFDNMSTLRNTYDQALVVITLLKMGETDKAKETLDEIYESYEYYNKIYKSNKEHYEITGEIVWVGLAAVQYKLATGTTKYDDMIAKVDEYLVERRSEFNYIFGSESTMIGNGAYCSTEHMLDVIAYLNLKTLLPDNDNIEADKELLEAVATFTVNKLMYPQTSRFARGYRDDQSALDTYSWGIQVFSALEKYNPEIYEACGFGNKKMERILDNVESDFRVNLDNEQTVESLKRKAGDNEELLAFWERYHLYSWSDALYVDKDSKENLFIFQDFSNSEINVSFEWSLQMAQAYFLLGDYKMAKTIFDDATSLADELGFENGIYPAANLNRVYNYPYYGWLVGRVPSLSATCTAALLQYSFMNGDPELGSPFYPVNEPMLDQEPSSILPQTINEINSLIRNEKFSLRETLKIIIGTETLKSLFTPLTFIAQHNEPSAKRGAKILVSVTTLAGVSAALIMSFLSLPAVFVALNAVMLSVFTNVTTHVIMDFRYLKASGLQEAVALYGKDAVSLTQSGVDVQDKDKMVNMYVINDRPQNFKDFNFKPVSTKVKTKDGKTVKCWLGNYNGLAVVFAQGADYENVVKEFTQTKQFESVYAVNGTLRTKIKADVNIIEIDTVNPDSALRYGENGNIVVGANVIKTNDLLDLKKEFALISNKKVDAVTINQNIAVFIDENIETVSSYDDLLTMANLYVKDTGLGTDTKVLFSDKYINRIVDLIRKDVSKTLTDEREIEAEVKSRFINIIQTAKTVNKEISVVFEDSDEKDLTKYFEYGIFSYVANGKYFDSITSTASQMKFVTNLDEIKSFDGSISVIRVSAFKNEMEKTSGIFTFLNSSLNIKEILEKRNVEFVKKAASNFDFNQLPYLDNNVVAEIINSSETNKYELLSKYLDEAGSVSMYYATLSGNKEKEAFIDAVLERMLAVNLLKDNDINLGLSDHKLEEILARALYVKYTTGIDDNKKSSLNFDVSQMTAAQAEQALMETISMLSDEAFVQNKPESVNAIIELIPLYADRNSDFRTESVELINVQNIRGILSAA